MLQSISVLKGAGSSVYLPFEILIIFHWSKWNKGLEGGLHHWETGIFSAVPSICLKPLQQIDFLILIMRDACPPPY